MNLEFAPADEARAERMGGYVARAYGCNVKPQADAPLNLCVDCGMPIERVKHSRRERCVDCSRERKREYLRRYRCKS